MRSSPSDTLQEIARDLDLVVYQLERPELDDAEKRSEQRRRIRKELERLRERIEEAAEGV